jgi:anthranilate phosphoribosyltransferase
MSDILRPWMRIVSSAISAGHTHNLDQSQSRDFFKLLLEGEGTDAQLATIFSVLRSKGTAPEELAGAAIAARERITFPELPSNAIVVASTRLGKRKSPSLGLASASIAAGCGIPVLLQASPGLRDGASPGDLWNHMCGDLTGDPKVVESMFGKGNLACWSPTFGDSGWERLQRIEDETLLRGIPDIVTKLLLPEGVAVLSAAIPGPVLAIAANALECLGHRNAIVVQGVESSFDPFVTNTTYGLRITEGRKSPLRLNPFDCGLFEENEPSLESVKDFLESEQIIKQVLLGIPSPALSSALLGAGLIISLANPNESISTCVKEAEESVRSGAAQRSLNVFINNK